MVDMITNASDRIYYSSFASNMTTPFYENYTLQSLLNDAAKRGVHIRLFYNTTGEYTNHTIPELQAILDPSIHITTVTASKQLPKSLQNTLHQKAYSYNHQKFLVCDQQE
jgi:phosphatidylserine/phosphatidylglycerophosphate/cardiolipin synthase-like enzyme